MRTRIRLVVLVIAAIAVLQAGPTARTGGLSQRPPLVAAAANLQPALVRIADAFAGEGHGRVDLVFGASGALTRQIVEGAPFELFLSADETFPARLARAGLTRDDGVIYAHGRLALFARHGSPLAIDAALDGLASLIAAGVPGRFAIANPEVAPYGRAAEAVLRARGLWDDLRPRLVYGDTIAQTAQFVVSGNAVGGLVAYSLVLDPKVAQRGTHVLVPETSHQPIRQRMVLLKRATARVRSFYAYLQGERARSIFIEQGYGLPQ